MPGENGSNQAAEDKSPQVQEQGIVRFGFHILDKHTIFLTTLSCRKDPPPNKESFRHLTYASIHPVSTQKSQKEDFSFGLDKPIKQTHPCRNRMTTLKLPPLYCSKQKNACCMGGKDMYMSYLGYKLVLCYSGHAAQNEPEY